MKTKNILLILFMSMCITTLKSQKKNVNVISSNIKWTGKEITTKIHYGSLKFKKGSILMNNGLVSINECF